MGASNNHFRKVLIIAYGFPPIAYVGTHRTLRFCRYLPGNGWMPTVITIKEDKNLHNDFNLLRKIPREIQISRTNNIDVWRSVWMRYSEGMNGGNGNGGGRKKGLLAKAKKLMQSIILNLFSIPDHMLFWVPFAVARGIALNKAEDYDIIYSTSPPHSEHLAGALLSKVCGKKWVVDFRDPIMDNFCLQVLPAYQRSISALLEKVIVRNAHRIILVSDLHYSLMTERYPAFRKKFVVIKNGFDPDQFKKLEPCSYNKFTILYTGSFYGPITPDFFLAGLKQWLDTKGKAVRDDVQVLFYGFGNKRVEMVSRELGLEDITRVFGFIPQDEIIKKQKGADLLLLILGFDEKSKGVISAKVYEYMAAGPPILALIPEGDALRIIQTFSKHYHVKENDCHCLVSSLDKAYDEYLEKKQAACQGSSNNRLSDLSLFGADLQVKDLARIFEETLMNN